MKFKVAEDQENTHPVQFGQLQRDVSRTEQDEDHRRAVCLVLRRSGDTGPGEHRADSDKHRRRCEYPNPHIDNPSRHRKADVSGQDEKDGYHAVRAWPA